MFAQRLMRWGQQFIAEITDYFYNRTGTDSGFLRLTIWFRLAILLSLTLRFGFDQDKWLDTPGILTAVRFCLGVYFLFIVICQFLADFYPHLFESTIFKEIQIGSDAVIVALFYYWAGQPGSDIFLFYFLPLIIVARYFSHRAMLALLAFIIATTMATWSVLVSPAEFTLVRFWVIKLLPRPAFLFILIVFYLVYRRRRLMVQHLAKAEDELLNQYKNLEPGVFVVDRRLRVTNINDVMRRRHGERPGRSCQEAFCRSSSNSTQPCSQCPLAAAINARKEVSNVHVTFVDRAGDPYIACLSALPLFDKQGYLTGATAIVQDFSRQMAFENQIKAYIPEVERVIEINAQEYRSGLEEQMRQLEAVSRASTAVLSLDQPFGTDEIVRAMAYLLGCQIADVRRYQVDAISGQESLRLILSFGYTMEPTPGWSLLTLEANSIVVKAFNTRKPLTLIDVQALPLQIRFIERAKRYGLHTIVCFPLLAQGERLGTISLYRNRRQRFAPSEMRLGEALANNLAAALYNQQLLAEQQGRTNQLLTLAKSLVTFSEAQSLEEALDKIAQCVIELLGCDMSGVARYDHDKKEIYGLPHCGFRGVSSEYIQNFRFSIDRPGGQILRDRDIFATSDATSDEESIFGDRLTGPIGARGIMGAPMIVGDREIGILYAASHTPRDFSEHERTVFKMLALQAAVAIRNLELYTAEKRRAELLAQMQDVDQYIYQLNDLREMLRHVVKTANDFLAADISYLTPYDAVNNVLLTELGVSYKSLDFRHATKPGYTGLTKRVMDAPDGLLLIEDLAKDDELRSQFAKQLGVASVAVVRLEALDKVVGILYVNYLQRHSFTSQEKKMLRFFAEQAAASIANALLIEKIKELEIQKVRNLLREDLHDSLNTFQFKLMLPLENLAERARRNEDSYTAFELERLWWVSSRINENFRRIMQDMRFPILVEQGLTAALKSLVANTVEGSLMKIKLNIRGDGRLLADTEHALYRIAQEALNNVVKHACDNQEQTVGRKVNVKVTLLLPDGHLIIQDDGPGFSSERISANGERLGMEAMQNWAKTIGYKLDVKAVPGEGVLIEARPQ